ncbi:DNA polymerase III subunit gamma and tau [uncultured Cellulomonas sp.]|uniref:DNA polymerase III subunit gamma and tau n=1 Tax=uncultured Cellulomonas sp. TaxID=189682 RepID=UPI0026256302|nr:DNA polymerase III subunit gamma and tau [uncultured Cellulomonas sp.]
MTTALYRRYRPENFAEVIGQEHVTVPLMQALRTGRINHAYLFSGPRGCGKTTSARILARCLNCAQGPTDTPCGVCPSCVELARGGPGSLDVVEIDAASHGGVDDARDLRERATFAPARDRFKIFILDEAHMVTPQGFNALLKIVEEPPEHVMFVFATTEPDKVIGTIRSRTHHYPFRLVPPDVLGRYLEGLCAAEGVPVGSGVLPLVIRAGAGSVRDSLSVLDQLVAGADERGLDYERAVQLLGYTHATLLDDLVEAVAAGDGASAFRVVERVITTGHEPRRFVEDLLERLRDLIVLAAAGEAADAALRDVPGDQLTRMRAQAAHLGSAELSRAADVVNAALGEMTGATSPRLHLELLIARLLLPAADDGTLGHAARLDRLERGVALPAGPRDRAVPEVASAGAGTPVPVATGARDRLGATPVGEPAADEVTAVAPLPTPVVAEPVEPAAAREPAPVPAPGPVVEIADAFPARPQPDAPAAGRPEPAAPAAGRPAGPPPASGVDEAPEAPGPAPSLLASGTPNAAPATPTPVTPPPGPARPAPGPALPAAAAPASASGSGVAGVETEVLRRRWPEVLDTLSRLKKATWAMVGQHAQVGELTGTSLTLLFPGPGLATAFRSGPHADVVQRAVRETLGFDVRIEGRVGDSTASAGGAPSSAPVRPADAPGRGRAPWTDAPPAHVVDRAAAEASWATVEPPDDDIPEGPVVDVAPPDPGPGRPSARAAGERAHAAAVQAAAASAPAVEDSPDPDDPDIASSHLTGPPLVAQLLGGTVIDEQVGDGG